MLDQSVNLVVITVAAFAGGLLNALAGGGSFFTLPALVFSGVPPVVANATGTTALLPGYLASAWSGREFIRSPAGLSVLLVVMLGAIGGTLGAMLLLVSSNEAFSLIVPWLLLFATLLFAFGPRLHGLLVAKPRRGGPFWGRAGIIGVSLYGGYFNGGMGIVILAAVRLMGVHDLNAANALKNLLSAVLTLVAVVVYAMGGLVSWLHVLPMAVAASAGGVLGVTIGRRVHPAALRAFIVIVGAATTLVFFLRT